MLLLLGIIAGLTFNHSAVAKNYDPTDDLLTAFGPSCGGFGRHSQRALQQSDTLKKIIESIHSDPSCDDIESALASVVSINERINSLQSTQLADNEAVRLERVAAHITAAMQAETDPTTIAALGMELASTKVALYRNQDQEKYLTEVNRIKATEMGLVYTENLLHKLKTNSACLENRPGLGLQIAGQAVAMSAGWAAATISPYLFVTGTLMDQLTGFVRDVRLNKRLKKLNTARLGMAAQCTIEAVSNTYCEARDTSLLIDALVTRPVPHESDAWVGVSLLDRDMRSYSAWIRRLVAGAPPSDDAAAELKTRGNQLEAALKVSSDLMQATLNVSKQRLEGAPTEDHPDILRRLIAQLAGNMSIGALIGSGTFGEADFINSNPYFIVFAVDQQCGIVNYLYTGRIENVRNDQGTCPTYQNVPIPDYQTLQQRVVDIIAKAESVVGREVALVRENDADSVFALSELEGPASLSALDFMAKLRAYLVRLGDIYGNNVPRDTAQLVVNTIESVDKVVELLDARYDESGNRIEHDPSATLSEIQKILAPKQDSLFLYKRLRAIVNWELNHRINRDLMPVDITEILRRSLGDLFAPLEIVGRFDSDAAYDDARQGRELSRANLATFANTFRKSLSRHLGTYASEPESVDAQRSLASFCALALAVPDLQDFEQTTVSLSGESNGRTTIGELCRSQVLRSVYPEDSLKVEYARYSGLPFHERACQYYDYRRRSYIYSSKFLRLRNGLTN